MWIADGRIGNRHLIKDALSNLTQVLVVEKLLKMMENTFYFISRAFSFSRYSNFCLDFLVMTENSSIKKMRLISKIMTSHLGSQTIAIHILRIILKSIVNQTIKFGQLVT